MGQTPIRVFVVDDIKLVRLGLTSALEQDAYIEVIGEADDGESGVAKTLSTKPDVVIMDLGLPGMDGLEATRRIKELNPQIKIIVLTSHESPTEAELAMRHGASAFCIKDVKIKRLIDIIKDVQKGAIWLSPRIGEATIQSLTHPMASLEKSYHDDLSQMDSLTQREQEVLKLMAQGKSNSEIADNLYISVHTVKSQVCSILQKLRVSDRLQAAVKAVKSGIA